MTSANFNRPGAIDLSSLGTPAASAPANSGAYVFDVTEADFDGLPAQSMQYPVILEITMASASETRSVDQILTRLAASADGRWVLARVDVETAPKIAQALRVQAVPTVIALIAGQVAPLFQGTRDESEIAAMLDEVLRVAVQNGVTGRARPKADAAASQPGEEKAPDPRFAAADAALSSGDFELAAKEFEKLIKLNPRDAEAIAGKAQSELLARSTHLDVAEAITKANASPQDIELQLAAADAELVQGDAEAAFGRLINLIRDLPAAEREPIRVRLVELFTTQDSADPVVLKARRELSSVLF